ncbi:T9SS type A sorting domain-containing protein [candidate division KSB1 bacterium]|nr:T9SS type A sorting domain-containing protein [candidate division KSB1 bacterium]
MPTMSIFLPNILAVPDGRPTLHQHLADTLLLAARCVLFVGIASCFAQPPDTLWTRTWVIAGDQVAYDATALPDGRFVLAGVADDDSGHAWGTVYMCAETGQTEWSRLFAAGSSSRFHSIDMIDQLSFVAAGSVTSAQGARSYLVRMRIDGDSVWTRSAGNTDFAAIEDVVSAGGDIFFTCGYQQSVSTGTSQLVSMKWDSSGQVIWARAVSMPYPTVTHGSAVANCADGGIVCAGYIMYETPPPVRTEIDVYVVRLDDDGDTLWTRRYGTDRDDEAVAVLSVQGAIVIVANSDAATAPLHEIYLIKILENGELVWERTYAFHGRWQRALAATYGDAQDVIVAGFERTDFPTDDQTFFAMRVDAQGDTVWTKQIGSSMFAAAQTVVRTDDNGYIFAGSQFDFSPGSNDIRLARVYPDMSVSPARQEHVDWLTAEIIPNPSSGAAQLVVQPAQHGNLTVLITDVLGRRLMIPMEMAGSNGERRYTLYTAGMPCGVYFVSIRVGNTETVKQLHIVK